MSPLYSLSSVLHPLTPRSFAMKPPAFLLAAALLLSTTGCATRGPLHVYTLSPDAERPVLDFGAGGSAEVPSFLEEEDRVTGFAGEPAPVQQARPDRPLLRHGRRAAQETFTLDPAFP